MNRQEYCRLIRAGIINQRRAERGFRALARHAPNIDVQDMMVLLHHHAHHNMRALQRQHARYCNGNLTTVL